MNRRFYYQGVEHDVTALSKGDHHQIQVDGTLLAATVQKGEGSSIQITLNDVVYTALVSVEAEHTDVCVAGHHFRFLHQPPQVLSAAGGSAGRTDGLVVSPMTGRIAKLSLCEGDSVQKGDELLIVEAMKMEFPVTAPLAGKILKIHQAQGEQVEMGTPLVEIQQAQNS